MEQISPLGCPLEFLDWHYEILMLHLWWANHTILLGLELNFLEIPCNALHISCYSWVACIHMIVISLLLAFVSHCCPLVHRRQLFSILPQPHSLPLWPHVPSHPAKRVVFPHVDLGGSKHPLLRSTRIPCPNFKPSVLKGGFFISYFALPKKSMFFGVFGQIAVPGFC